MTKKWLTDCQTLAHVLRMVWKMFSKFPLAFRRWWRCDEGHPKRRWLDSQGIKWCRPSFRSTGDHHTLTAVTNRQPTTSTVTVGFLKVVGAKNPHLISNTRRKAKGGIPRLPWFMAATVCFGMVFLFTFRSCWRKIGFFDTNPGDFVEIQSWARMVQTRYGKLIFRAEGSEKVNPPKHCDKVKTVNHMCTAAKQLPLNQSKNRETVSQKKLQETAFSICIKVQDPTLSKPVVQLQFLLWIRSCKKKKTHQSMNRWRDP